MSKEPARLQSSTYLSAIIAHAEETLGKVRAGDLPDGVDDLSGVEPMTRTLKVGGAQRETGRAGARERWGSPVSPADVRQAYAALRVRFPHAKAGGLHASLAQKYDRTQRSIRRYLKDS